MSNRKYIEHDHMEKERDEMDVKGPFYFYTSWIRRVGLHFWSDSLFLLPNFLGNIFSKCQLGSSTSHPPSHLYPQPRNTDCQKAIATKTVNLLRAINYFKMFVETNFGSGSDPLSVVVNLSLNIPARLIFVYTGGPRYMRSFYLRFRVYAIEN